MYSLKEIAVTKKCFITFILAEEFFIVILYPIKCGRCHEPIDESSEYDTK